MAPPAVYRVPRRFISFPQDPPPYGSLAASLCGHVVALGAAIALSSLLGAQLDQSRVYVVNLVPTTPTLGRPAAEPAPPVSQPRRPEPAARPAPRVEEKAPPKPARPEPARPEPPPPPPRERAVEPPPARAPQVARAAPVEPSELALPRRAAERDPTTLPAAATRPIDRSLPPPPPVLPTPPALPPAPPTRLPEPPRVAAPPAPPAATAAAPPAPAPAVAMARPAVDPIRLGRPNAPSTSTGSIAVDASDFPFTYYLRLIQSKIGERWTPPRAAAAGGERAVILFEIQRDGQVVREPVLERSSGNGLYDQSAIRAVTEASPFPPLPPEFKASALRVHFGFEFNPDRG
ncbi:MAG TPA: TonB family protein [Methylomirabilota bacterium]|nr:TonB family protein [Methylomirabilota bacterium]